MTKNELTLFSKFNITSADTDMQGRLRLGSLANLLIQSAINSADELGFGFVGLKQQKLFWVLSRLTIEIYKPLKWYDVAEVETWPKNVERIIYLRDFIVRNQNNEIVAKATSGWLAIDIETKRPKTIDGLQGLLFSHLKDKNALSQSPEKLLPVCNGEEFIFNTTYFDVDLNKHVTSSRYIDWLMDTMTVDFHLENYPKLLSINYIKETQHDQSIKIIRSNNSSEYLFDGINSTEKSAVRGKIIF